jgi:lysylphosphatidylglycerol synthetase-like protein (DUF2156 family)
MKKLQNDIFKKLFILFVLLIISLLVVVFFLFNNFIESTLLSVEIDKKAVLSEFYYLVSIIVSISFIFIAIVYKYIKKVEKNFLEDFDSLRQYIYNISLNKKYDATLHIKHYLEFLHISIVLKNIVKRLRAKTKKK